MAETMKAWQVAGPGPLEKTLRLNDKAPRPEVANGLILVEVACASINPADYKLPEMGLASKAVIKFPKTLGMDFSGRVVGVGEGVTSVKAGDPVVGRLDPMKQQGTLSQFVLATPDACVALPADVNVDFERAAGMPTTALTAYQTIVPNVKAGDKVFLNGGSGGAGTFGIQIAKAHGCHVTVSCSTEKVALCKELGADEIIDYKTSDVVAKLKEMGQVFNLCVDNVGASPAGLYPAADKYLVPGAKYIFVGGRMSLDTVKTLTKGLILPGFLGGGKRKFETYLTKNSEKDLGQIVKWVAEGKVKTVVDEVFGFEDADKAYAKLKGGRSTGKIVVRVGAPEAKA